MPTYDYKCSRCRKTFEAFQSMKDAPYTVCPEALCQMKTWGKGKVQRQLGTGAGLIFKGSGFYITDYRSESYKQGAKKEAPKESSGKSSGQGKSGSDKPAPAASKKKSESS